MGLLHFGHVNDEGLKPGFSGISVLQALQIPAISIVFDLLPCPLKFPLKLLSKLFTCLVGFWAFLCGIIFSFLISKYITKIIK